MNKQKTLAIIGGITIVILLVISIGAIFISSEVEEKYDDGWEIGETYKVLGLEDKSMCLKKEGEAPLCMMEGDTFQINCSEVGDLTFTIFTAIEVNYPLIAKKIKEDTTLYTDASGKYSWLEIKDCEKIDGKYGGYYQCSIRTEEVKNEK